MFCGIGKNKKDNGPKLPDWTLSMTMEDIDGRIDHRVDDEMSESK